MLRAFREARVLGVKCSAGILLASSVPFACLYHPRPRTSHFASRRNRADSSGGVGLM